MAEANVPEDGKIERRDRSLGSYESIMTYFSDKYSTGTCWLVSVINTSQALQDDDIFTACKIIVRKQEILQMRIIDTNLHNERGLHFYFSPMENPEKVDFESVTFNTKDDWPMYISRDHEKSKIDRQNGPLWRIILGRVEVSNGKEPFPYQNVIILKFMHSVIDGISLCDFFNYQFMPILFTLINGADAEKIKMIPTLKLIESADEIFLQSRDMVSWRLKLSLNFIRLKNRIFKTEQGPVFMFPDEKPLMNPQNSEFNSSQTVKEAPCIPKIFGEQISVSVIDAAKKHDVTVHCVLLTASAIAFCRTANLAEIKLPRSFKQRWPISLRKFTSMETPHPLGLIVAEGISVHESMMDCTKDDFWKLCRQMQMQVNAECNEEKYIGFLSCLRYIANATEKANPLEMLLGMGSPPYLFLSNLGQISADPKLANTDGSIKLQVAEEYVTVTGSNVPTWCPIAQFMMTFRQRFMWSINYNPRKVSRKFVETYLEQYQSVLNAFCR